MFTRLFIFLFVVVGCFALLFSFIPADYFIAGYESTIGSAKEIRDKLEVADLLIYTQLGADNMIYPYASVLDGPTAPDWEILGTTDHFFEVWWDEETYLVGVGKTLECRHTYKVWWWYEYHRMSWINPVTGSDYGKYLGPVTLDATWNDEINGSKWYAQCEHITASIIVTYNTTDYASFQEAWDGGEIGYVVSYEANATLSGASATSMLGQLITFQSPDLGIDGVLGDILNKVIAIVFYAMIVVLIVMVVLSVVPFIRGLPE